MNFRTDENNNPTAFTTDIARQAGLVYGIDYTAGTPFPAPSKLVTAKLLGDCVSITIRVIHEIGFYTGLGAARWAYIAIPRLAWTQLGAAAKRDVIGFMYQREGGTALRHRFPRYGTL